MTNGRERSSRSRRDRSTGGDRELSRGPGFRAAVQQQGWATVFTIELRNLSGEERRAAETTIEAFAWALADRLKGDRRAGGAGR